MDYLECSCKGENPNCFKCDGTGIVTSAKEQIGRPSVQLGTSQQINAEQNSSQLKREKIKKKGSLPTEEDIESIARNAYYRAREKIQKRKEKELKKKLALENSASTEVTYVKQSITSEGTLHSQSNTVEVKVIPKKSNRELADCPFCNAKVKNLDKHLEKSHTPEGRERQEKLKQSRKVRKSKRKEKMQSKSIDSIRINKEFKEYKRLYPQANNCGFCRGFFKDVDALREHLRQNHPHAGNTEPWQTPKKSKVHRVSNSGKHNLGAVKFERRDEHQKYEDPKAEQKMDATYGLGGFARDRGRFGSPSAYDNMDDESFS